MYLYRVEHKESRVGPYYYYGPDLMDAKIHLYEMDTHPSPRDENLDFSFGMHCGFESKAKLLDWFTFQDLKDFQKHGLNVYKIHVEWVEKGEKQLIFDPATVSYRKKIDLKDLRRWKQRCICSLRTTSEPKEEIDGWVNSAILPRECMDLQQIRGSSTTWP